MYARQGACHLVIHGPAGVGTMYLTECRIPIDIAVAIFHQVEHGADYRRILTQVIDLGNGHIGVPQRGKDTILTVDRMGRLEQLSGRLPTQHIGTGVSVNPESWI